MTTAPQLRHLEARGLIRPLAEAPDLAYLFRHALVQDAAYSSLLRADRRRLHGIVATTLEPLYEEYPDALAPLLATHFDEAGADDQARHYHTLAGDSAARKYATGEALAHYSRALALARRAALPGRQLQDLYMARGRVLELVGRFGEALAGYTELAELARVQDDRPLVLAALMAQATVRSIATAEHSLAGTLTLCNAALALARELGDQPAEAKILWQLLVLYGAPGSGHLQEAQVYGEQSLALARALGLREQLAYSLGDLAGYCYLQIGDYTRAQAALDEACVLWRELDNRPMLANTLTNCGVCTYYSGQYTRALAISEEAIQLSESIGNLWGQAFGRWPISMIYLDRGEPGQAAQALEETIRLGEQVGFLGAAVIARALLAKVLAFLGATDRALAETRQAWALAEAQFTTWRGMVLVTFAYVHAFAGHWDEAATFVDAAHTALPEQDRLSGPILALAEAELALARQDSGRVAAAADALDQLALPIYLPDTLYYRGQVARAAGQIDVARALWEAGREHAVQLGIRRSLWPLLAALADLEAAQGHVTVATTLQQEAATVITYIADHAGSAALRASFLDRPAVRRVLTTRRATGDLC
ncbi:MAG TPA: tetratricopeptide repeat protein [Chloroflexia bacterium]|nr:tetratricopeptide repeat protein [Chloroflexia bacterium]